MLIIDRTEIEKHVHTKVWNETVSKYQVLCSVLIEIPTGELESWLDSYSEGIALICKNTLTPFQERANEISYIYIEYGGEPKWVVKLNGIFIPALKMHWIQNLLSMDYIYM